MNKLLIGLLIAAAGAGAFFLLRKKKETNTANTINKEWIIGKWKTASIQPVKDSAQPLYSYDFQKDGLLFRSVSDTVKADSTHYEWNSSNELVMKENKADTTGKVYTISRLTPDSLQVLSKDSVSYLYIRVR